MGICAADMKTCDKKNKCLFGPNEGLAYNPQDPCCGAGDFNASTCDCEQGCVSLYMVVTMVDGKVVTNGIPCSSEYCSDPLILCGSPSLTGLDPQDVSVKLFYSPSSCGTRTRGALLEYRFPTLCDNTPDNVLRTQSVAQSNGTDIQPLRADVYVAPSPLPQGCVAPAASARQSEGVSSIPSCFTLVASAVNTATDRIVCP